MTLHLRHIFSSLVLLAMMTAALVPAGFMPASAKGAAGDTLYALVLCTGYGEKTVYVPAGQSPEAAPQSPAAPANHDTADHQSPCAYAPLNAPVTLAAAPDVLPIAFMQRVAHSAADTSVTHITLRKNWHAQAPPLS